MRPVFYEVWVDGRKVDVAGSREQADDLALEIAMTQFRDVEVRPIGYDDIC